MSDAAAPVRPKRRPFRLTAPVTPEHQAQIDAAKMLARVLRPGVCWTAIDHANACDALTGAIRKARGAKAGVPDLLFWSDGLPFAIEMKAGDGRLSAAQVEFHRMLKVARVPVKVCRGVGEVFDQVMAWGLCRPGLRVAA